MHERTASTSVLLGAWGNSGALGGGIVEYVYPEPAQRNVPRNTAIVMTFTEAVDPASFILNADPAAQTGDLNDALVHVHPQAIGGLDLQSSEVRVALSEDGRTVVLKPNAPLGNSTAPVWYEVVLDGGSDGIKKQDGSALFAGAFDGGFDWSFEVSTEIDNEPPTITSVFPFDGGSYPRNSVIQIQFSEPMMPVSVAGVYDPQLPQPFTNVETLDESGSGLVTGEYRLSNGYRSLAFLTTDFCGTNSCNVDIFCLPADTTMRVRVKSATLSTTPPLAAKQGAFGFDGAVDMAGNSLDGGKPFDGVADGPPSDDYVFSFGTTDEIRLSPPVITEINPRVLEGEVLVDEPVSITWNEGDLLLAHTIHPGSVSLSRKGPQEDDPANATNWWFFPKLSFLDASGTIAGFDRPPVRSQITLRHRPFIPSDAPTAGQTIWDSLNIYAPHVQESVMNVYQNCFNPATSELIPGSRMTGSPNRCNEQSTSQACDQYMP